MTFPAYTYDDLTSPDTEEMLLSYLLTWLAKPPPDGPGFAVTAWQPGDVAYTLVRLHARSLSDLLQSVALVARAGVLESATGSWLTALGDGFYDETRIPATTARIRVQLSSQPSFTSAIIAPHGLWIATSQGLRYNSANATSVALTRANTSSVTPFLLDFVAESPGSKYNLDGPPATVNLTMQTVIVGVNALAAPATTGAANCMVTRGNDLESDDAFRQRCRDKWATLAELNGTGGATAAAYEYYAKAASPDVKRVRVIDSSATEPGLVRVVIAGETGAITTGGPVDVVGAVDTAVRAIKPITATVNTESAVLRTISLHGTVYRVNAVHRTVDDARSWVNGQLTALASAIPIGGKVFYSAVIDALVRPEIKGTGSADGTTTAVTHIRNVTGLRFSAGLTDVTDITLAANEIVSFDTTNLDIASDAP